MTTVLGILVILALFVAVPVVMIGTFLAVSARRQQRAEAATAESDDDPDGPTAPPGPTA